jgi:hypothetical protein
MATTYSRNGKVPCEVAHAGAEEPHGCNCLCPGHQRHDIALGVATPPRRRSRTWTADAWAVERVDPDTWGRRDRLDVSGTMTVVEMRAFFVAVVGLLERYVPPERLEAELANLIAATDEIAGGMRDRPAGG